MRLNGQPEPEGEIHSSEQASDLKQPLGIRRKLESRLMEHFRDSSVGLSIRRQIVGWPWYQHVPLENLFTFYLKLKLRVLLSLISDTARMSLETRKRIKSTRSFKGSDSRPALVIGSGPSAKNLTNNQIVKFQSMGGKIVVMNGFADSPLSTILRPDYYCLVDPDFWNPLNQSDYRHIERIKEFIRVNSPSCIVIQPAYLPPFIGDDGSYFFVDSRSVAGLYRSAQPDRPWGLVGSVAMLAIASMQFIGHSVVYFTGLDSVMSRSFFVDDMNQLLWDSRDHYFYEAVAYKEDRTDTIEPGVLKVGSRLFRNFADVLYSDAIFRKDLYWLMKNSCVNVGNDRTNDAAPRACLLG